MKDFIGKVHNCSFPIFIAVYPFIYGEPQDWRESPLVRQQARQEIYLGCRFHGNHTQITHGAAERSASGSSGRN